MEIAGILCDMRRAKVSIEPQIREIHQQAAKMSFGEDNHKEIPLRELEPSQASLKRRPIGTCFTNAKELQEFLAKQAQARDCLENGINPTKLVVQLTALAQAKIAFVKEMLQIVANFRCKAFASIASPQLNLEDTPEYLRKDYDYLFERVLLLSGGQTARTVRNNRF
ncbi:MAG: hypothetical protein IPP17_02755 [Bacteroidetes bacterium]|nr:hypothetical protein [Bacteroidota bacterium]